MQNRQSLVCVRQSKYFSDQCFHLQHSLPCFDWSLPILKSLFPGSIKVLRNRTRITQSLMQHGHIVFVLQEENSNFIQRQVVRSRVHWSIGCLRAETRYVCTHGCVKETGGHTRCLPPHFPSVQLNEGEIWTEQRAQEPESRRTQHVRYLSSVLLQNKTSARLMKAW